MTARRQLSRATRWLRVRGRRNPANTIAAPSTADDHRTKHLLLRWLDWEAPSLRRIDLSAVAQPDSSGGKAPVFGSIYVSPEAIVDRCGGSRGSITRTSSLPSFLPMLLDSRATIMDLHQSTFWPLRLSDVEAITSGNSEYPIAAGASPMDVSICLGTSWKLTAYIKKLPPYIPECLNYGVIPSGYSWPSIPDYETTSMTADTATSSPSYLYSYPPMSARVSTCGDESQCERSSTPGSPGKKRKRNRKPLTPTVALVSCSLWTMRSSSHRP